MGALTSPRPRFANLASLIAPRKAEVTTESILAELEEARLLALSLDQPAAAVAASMGKAKVSGNLVQRHEHGKLGDFSHLNDEELKESLYDVTKSLAETPGVRRVCETVGAIETRDQALDHGRHRGEPAGGGLVHCGATAFEGTRD